MSDLYEHKCPTCGQPLRFNPVSGLLKCDFCNKDYDLNDFAVSDKESASNSDSKSAVLNDQGLPIYVCQSCGAEIVARREEVSLTCPYCSSSIVITDKVSGNIKPDGIVPFKVDKNRLSSLLEDFFKDKKLLPKDFIDKKKISKLTGIYVPFWIFDGDLSGQIQYENTRVREYRDGDYRVKETSYYRVVRDASMSFKDLPCDASRRMPDDFMDSLEPYDISDVKDFDIQYLAGFASDRYDVNKEDLRDRAFNRMSNTAHSITRSEAFRGYDSCSYKSGGFGSKLKAKYILLPVYLYNVLYENESYNFAVNGQTGKVVGKLPISGKASLKYYFLHLLIVAPIAMLICFLIWYFGGK